jgi:hypothetical protein
MTKDAVTLTTGSEYSVLKVFSGAVLCAAAVLVSGALAPKPVSALPSFARQTGQPCATCHNGTYAQLTPFGREFKLNGYTAGGTRCHDMPAMDAGVRPELQVPISMMVISGFTHVQKDLPGPQLNRDGLANGLNNNNNAMPIEAASLFLGGQIYCKLGAFAQVTYGRADDVYSIDNAELRYADKAKIAGMDVLYGFFGNNNPTLDDVWNTTPAWRIPGGGWVASTFSGGGPPIAPLIDGGLAGTVGGGGAYVRVNNMFYVAVGAYKSLDRKTQNVLGLGDSTTALDGFAPYGRVAIEKNIGPFSFMVGAFGLIADMKPDITQITRRDHYTDAGIDSQIQYLEGKHFVTLRASYIQEWLRLGGTTDVANNAGDPAPDNLKNRLSELNLSATYAYDSTYSVTLGYFDTRSTADFGFFGGNVGQANSRGEVLDLGYSPFSHGGPALWPWLNTRIGVQFTHYEKTNGSNSNYDGAGRNAKDDDAVWFYSWTAY